MPKSPRNINASRNHDSMVGVFFEGVSRSAAVVEPPITLER